MTPCWLVNSYWRLAGACCLHLQGRNVRPLNTEASSVSVEYIAILLTNTPGCAKLNSETNDWGEVMKLVTLFHRVWSLPEVTSRSASQKMQDLIKDPTDHYRFCKILLLVFITRLFSSATHSPLTVQYLLNNFGWLHSKPQLNWRRQSQKWHSPMVVEKKECRKDNAVDGNALVETANSGQYSNMHYCWIGRKGGRYFEKWFIMVYKWIPALLF